MAAELHSFPASRPRPTAGTWAADQLSGITDLLSAGRRYGFAVTATPDAMRLLRTSGHMDADLLAANVCPVASDPWQDADGHMTAARAAEAVRARTAFVVATTGAVLCGIMAIEQILRVNSAPGNGLDRLSLTGMFGLICWLTWPRARGWAR